MTRDWNAWVSAEDDKEMRDSGLLDGDPILYLLTPGVAVDPLGIMEQWSRLRSVSQEETILTWNILLLSPPFRSRPLNPARGSGGAL